MKKFLSIISLFILLFTFQSCSSQPVGDPKIINDLVNSQEFTFHAQRANPTNNDVVRVMNSLPNASGNRILDLDAGSYVIEVKKDSLAVILPYFGRLFNPNFGNTSNNSYRFVSKDFLFSKTQNKKGNWVVKIAPTDVNNVSEIFIEIFKNGKAYTSVRSNDRQPISYDGYISENEKPK